MNQLLDYLTEFESYYQIYDIKKHSKELTNLYESMNTLIENNSEIQNDPSWKDVNLRLYEAQAKMDFANKKPEISYKSIKGIYKCLACDFSTKSKCSIQSHYQSYDHFYTVDDEDGMEECKCKSCGKIFDTITKRKRHQKLCEANLHCKKCNKTFSTPNYFKKHVCNPEGTINPYCKVCDKRFASVQCYQNHQITNLHKKKLKHFLVLNNQ